MDHGGTESLSIVITAFNEGSEVFNTIKSIVRSGVCLCEIIIVDDGSTDGCCEFEANVSNWRIVRHDQRIGIAYSRNEGSQLARGGVIGYFDGHQRAQPGSLEQCARLAHQSNAIVCPDVCGFDDDVRLHGAYFTHDRTEKPVAAEWKRRTPLNAIGHVSALKAPAYFIPRPVYEKVGWSSLSRGWGGSEATVSLKAFFSGVDILHLCGPLIRHQFKEKFHYEVGWRESWRNQAITVRTCFDDRAWYDYWLPEVFESQLSVDVLSELESDAVKAEQAKFAQFKVRQDREFWTQLIFKRVPDAIK